ncbi:MAG TPA: nucleotidyltransferase domain-containing protein, partial [Ignavibacteriaceae bacterium]|nr:nucleotidyltransferase domain-containing protein [Ignavibacteriaceae bacterium]
MEIKKRLLEKFELKKIIIFGSQARGTADNRSDIDLLIVSQEIPDRYKLMREIRRSLLPMDFAFDIIAVTPE